MLISSIFFIADSVVKGHFKILKSSILFNFVVEVVGTFGFLFKVFVFGRKKWTFLRIFDFLEASLPFTLRAVFLADLAADLAFLTILFLVFYI